MNYLRLNVKQPIDKGLILIFEGVYYRNEGGIMITFDCHWKSTKILNP
jgi:hypothetical protein